MKIFDQAGKMALGSRVRLLSDRISGDAAAIYKLYETNLNPKWFPVFYTLTKGSPTGTNLPGTNMTVTGLANHVGHSHASVSKIIAEMSAAGIVQLKSDLRDRRRTSVILTKKGRAAADKIESQYVDVRKAIDDLLKEASHNLWEAVAEWESLLDKKSLLRRVGEIKKQSESADVRIVPFRPKYKEAFYLLNEEWIQKYFKMEKPDYDALHHPKEYILDKGGYIYVALLKGEPVGVCALIRRKDLACYELAKMAVSPKAQGRHIGLLLGRAVVEKAQQLRADRVFLESNTLLKPAINLYEKLGFKKIVGPPTPYERCNIQMELSLNARKARGKKV